MSLVERLLEESLRGSDANRCRLFREAADEIERLQAKIKKYEDEQCGACRAYREIEERAALKDTKP